MTESNRRRPRKLVATAGSSPDFSPTYATGTAHEEAVGAASSIKDKAKDAGAGVVDAVALGAKLVAVNKTGDALMRIVRRVAEKNATIAGLLETDEGREIAKGFVAMALYFGGSFEVFPAKANVPLRRVGGLQITASTVVLGNKYGDMLLDELEGLVEIGLALGDDELTNPIGIMSAGRNEKVVELERPDKAKADK